MSEQAGKSVAGHELLEQIGYDGAGGFGLGDLWKARDPTGRLVALKMASPDSLPMVRIKERNQYPNLVQLFGYWLVDGVLAIATDMLTGRPMRLCLEESQTGGHAGMSQDEVLVWVEDIANAVDFLNMPKYVDGLDTVANRPCDVTPNHLLVTPEKAILDDLQAGVYEVPSRKAEPESIGIFGYLAYSAPECWGGSPCSASSQYSLAVTYYELRTGALPFSDFPTERGDWDAFLKERKVDLSDIPAAERRVLQRGLSDDPKDRYGSCLELVRCLRSACQR